MNYIWEKENWTNFLWSSENIIDSLATARKKQGIILGKGDTLELRELSSLLAEEAMTTSEIEGEKLDRESVRSSVARRLGLPTAGLPETRRETDGLVQVLIDATANYATPLSFETLWGWQAALFPTGYSGLQKIQVGLWREKPTPMQVISGSMGKEKIHYLAPPTTSLQLEMSRFIEWWNNQNLQLDGMIRAAIAHFRFVTIHPFEDGNGRIARALTDRALAQDEKTGKRLYSLSSQIIKEKTAYYDILENSQKGNGDITDWLNWFLQMFSRSIDASLMTIESSIFKNTFYRILNDLIITERQKKVIDKLLAPYPEEFKGGLTNKKYVSMTKISPETAKRDIKDLLDKGILLKNGGGGRSASYRLNLDMAKD
ncbi:Fic family protein [Spirochaeta isovalerica]|uniref:Fic family protein n=1 Tax=Spirochaeta isovalerica TaxID=150 RepID=A0A841RGJ5_9SPIO|nr:Fic family protein [Spirochaeta isovalerica]MBB6482140.1 Fic family protein [Spirochaeta isovalerica]